MALQALNFSRGKGAKSPECLKAVEGVFQWVGDDESGPADARMMWILSADDGGDDEVKLDLTAKLPPQEPAYTLIFLPNNGN
jgi:hypothetical protein